MGQSDFADPDKAWAGVMCHRPYHPYRFMGGQNPAFKKATDGRLLDFKDNLDHGIRNAVADFLELLERLTLPTGTIVVVVPGHAATPSNAHRPLARAALEIAAQRPALTASIDSLVRTVTIPKLATGGDRDVGTHVRSMAVRQPPTLAGVTVVVLDDTVTSGHSVQAARALLLQAGAKAVAAIALGQTVKYL